MKYSIIGLFSLLLITCTYAQEKEFTLSGVITDVDGKAVQQIVE